MENFRKKKLIKNIYYFNEKCMINNLDLKNSYHYGMYTPSKLT